MNTRITSKCRMPLSVSIIKEYREKAKGIEEELYWVRNSDILTKEEALEKEDMLSKKKRELAKTVYKSQHPRARDSFCYSGGYYRSKAPVYYAKTEEELLEKLFRHYFKQDIATVFYSWLQDYGSRGIWDPKTIKEHEGVWRNHIEPIIGDRHIGSIKKHDIKRIYQIWTGKGKITKKAFYNYRSTLNGIFRYASDRELIPVNIVREVDTRDLRFKAQEKKPSAYTVHERQQLLDHLNSVPDDQRDGYYFAIKLALYMPLRFGELAGIQYSDIDFSEHVITINRQLRHCPQVDVDVKKNSLVSEPRRPEVKSPKGNPDYSIRRIPMTKTAARLLKDAHRKNPFSEYLFMLEGRPLNADTFNDHLRKYETQCGLPYLSSHKLRFTVASILYHGNQGMNVTDLQKILGHSNVAMTLHYVQAYTGNEAEIHARTAAIMDEFLENKA